MWPNPERFPSTCRSPGHGQFSSPPQPFWFLYIMLGKLHWMCYQDEGKPVYLQYYLFQVKICLLPLRFQIFAMCGLLSATLWYREPCNSATWSIQRKIILQKQSGSVESLIMWIYLRTYLYLVLCLYSIAIDKYIKLVELKARKLLISVTTWHGRRMSVNRYNFTVACIRT
jgi:hypothetical protein